MSDLTGEPSFPPPSPCLGTEAWGLSDLTGEPSFPPPSPCLGTEAWGLSDLTGEPSFPPPSPCLGTEAWGLSDLTGEPRSSFLHNSNDQTSYFYWGCDYVSTPGSLRLVLGPLGPYTWSSVPWVPVMQGLGSWFSNEIAHCSSWSSQAVFSDLDEGSH